MPQGACCHGPAAAELAVKPAGRRAIEFDMPTGASDGQNLQNPRQHHHRKIGQSVGAGEGNRTLVCSLGSCRSTIELRPRYYFFLSTKGSSSLYQISHADCGRFFCSTPLSCTK